MHRLLGVFGATGTIGDNTLSIVRMHPELFDVRVLSANHNADKLIALAQEFSPALVAIADENAAKQVRDALPSSITVLSGEAGIEEAAVAEYDMMISAITGFSALRPTIAAIRAGKMIALANKECLVAAGSLFMQECARHNTTLIPVDSEHNGLFQLWEALRGVMPASVTLTASGGPFRETPLESLQNVSVAQAVAHPNWNMGAKISVDSATMMNKGLELIEAQHLFSLSPDQLNVLIHPQSVVHCFINFDDGAQLAQLSVPDMRTPLSYAMGFPERLALDMPMLNLSETASLSFAKADMQRFPCLALAFNAMRAGGSAPIVLNAANEVAVDAFLSERIGFTEIADSVSKVLDRHECHAVHQFDDVFGIDADTRSYTLEVL